MESVAEVDGEGDVQQGELPSKASQDMRGEQDEQAGEHEVCRDHVRTPGQDDREQAQLEVVGERRHSVQPPPVGEVEEEPPLDESQVEYSHCTRSS